MSTTLYARSIGVPAHTPTPGAIWEQVNSYRSLTGLTYSAGSPNVTGPAGTFSSDDAGKAASGTAVPGGATIATVTDDQNAVLSTNFSANGLGGTGTMGITYGAPIRRPMGLSPAGTARNYVGSTKSGATNPSDILLVQLQLDFQLDAQTITGTWEVSFAAFEDNNLLNAITQARFFLINSSGTEYAELYSGTTSTTTGSAGTPANNQEWQGTNSGAASVRYFSASVTSQAVSAGSRLVLELGYRANTANTGNNASARIGDPTGDSDAPAAGNGTSGTAGTLRTWIGLSHTLVALAVPNVPTSLGEVHDSDSIDFSWAAPSSGSTPTGYEVRIDGGSWIDTGTSLTHTFSGLTPGATYDLEVRAYNLAGAGTAAALNDITTTGLPNSPENLDEDHDTDSILLTYTAPSTGPTPTGYEVRLDGGTPVAANGSGGLSHDFTGLTPDTSYLVEVRAYNADGASGWVGLTVSTDDIAPGPPEDLTNPSATATTLDLAWDPPSTGGGVTSYEVRIDGGTPTTATSPHTFSGLTELVTYTLEVRAVGPGGSSSWATLEAETSETVPTAPAEGYAAVLQVGAHRWEVTSDDPADYGPLAGLKVAWTARQDDGWPTQPDPMRLTFQVLVEEGDDLTADLDTPVRFRFWADGAGLLVDFGGLVRDLSARPAPKGMLYTFVCLDYLSLLPTWKMNVGVPEGTPSEDVVPLLLAGATPTLPDPFDPPTVPYPFEGGASEVGVSYAYSGTVVTGLLAWLAQAAFLSSGRAILRPVLDGLGLLDSTKPYEAVWADAEAINADTDLGTLSGGFIPADLVETASAEWRRLRLEPNRAEDAAGVNWERDHPGIPTLTRRLTYDVESGPGDTSTTPWDTNGEWVAYSVVDQSDQWSTGLVVRARYAPEIVAGWFTLPDAMQTLVVVDDIATRHHPSGSPRWYGMLAGAELTIPKRRDWFVTFRLRRSLPALPEDFDWAAFVDGLS